jgi:hypothetical protein
MTLALERGPIKSFVFVALQTADNLYTTLNEIMLCKTFAEMESIYLQLYWNFSCKRYLRLCSNMRNTKLSLQ